VEGKQPRQQKPKFRIAERRQHERYVTDLQVRFRKYSRKDLSKCEPIYHTGWIRNMSMSGMLLESEIYLEKGQELEIYVTDNTSGPFYAMVETVRSRKAVDFYEVGVRIIHKESL